MPSRPHSRCPRRPRPRAAGLVRLAALGLLLAGLTGCQNIQTTATDTAHIRFIDASPDSPSLDIYQNGNAVAYNLGFGTITSYVPLSPGAYTLTADAAGTRQTLVSAKQTLAVDHHYTAIVGNFAANLQETILADQTMPAPSGQISVRIIDQANRAGAVDIYLVPTSGKLATTAPLATGIAFTGNTGYINVSVANYTLAVVPTGTIPVSTTATLFTGPQVVYAAGTVLTVVLIDSPLASPPAVQAIVADDYDLSSVTM